MPENDKTIAEKGKAAPEKAVSSQNQSGLIDFGVKTLTEQGAKLIENLQFLYTPAKGYVTWLNDTDKTLSVETFDQDDAVRWIRYEERKVAPHQVVQLTARGERIHVLVKDNGCTYDCTKGNAYLFDGTHLHPKK